VNPLCSLFSVLRGEHDLEAVHSLFSTLQNVWIIYVLCFNKWCRGIHRLAYQWTLEKAHPGKSFSINLLGCGTNWAFHNMFCKVGKVGDHWNTGSEKNDWEFWLLVGLTWSRFFHVWGAKGAPITNEIQSCIIFVWETYIWNVRNSMWWPLLYEKSL